MKNTDPTILAIDVADATLKALGAVKGIHTEEGSFGNPVRVELGRGMVAIDEKTVVLPNYKEADGFLIDLRSKKFRKDELSPPPDHVKSIFTSGRDGQIDARPYFMSVVSAGFDRVLDNGGLFIVFVAPVKNVEYITGHLESRGHHLIDDSRQTESNYSFLSKLLQGLEIRSDYGRDMSVLEVDTPLRQLLSKHLIGGHFSCTIHDHTDWERWSALAVNKFGDCVAAARYFNDARGLVVLFPTLQDEPEFVANLFRNVLPELSPHIFPDLQRSTWALNPPYEMQSITDLKAKIATIEEEVSKKVLALNNEIEAERSRNAYLFDLVRATGTPLVTAVKNALGELGFKDVLDVDEQLKAEQHDPDLREDLQIRDSSPLLTVDVKGLGNFPSDADALQAHKHASMRIQEYERLDIRALAIINHQRHLPPLERDNEMPFRKELLKVAAQVKMGFMTTWDLHRLLRNAKKWSWPTEVVLPVFYRLGRIDPIPEHYLLIGSVEHFYEKPKAASIRLSDGLRIGDRIAFEFPVEFEELQVESLQIDKNAVKEATAGSLCGVITPFQRKDLKVGSKVYLVRK